MKVPIVEFTRHYAAQKAQIDAAVARVLDSGWYILGQEVAALEKELGAYLGARHVVGVASGTDALCLALRASGIGEGDEVICPAMTATATPMAIRMTGAVPVFADVEPTTLCLDPADAARRVTERTKAIIPVHLYGGPADLDPLVDLCRMRGLTLIEDCAQAAGTTYRGRRVGTFGAAAAFSFYPTKNLGAFGDAGAVVTDDPQVEARVRRLRAYGEAVRYHADEEGINSRLDEIQAAILRAKLGCLDAHNARRQQIARRYAAGLDPRIAAPPTARDPDGHIYHLYVVRTDRRAALQEHLAASGIGTAVHYPVAQNRQKAFAKWGQGDDCPVAARETERILSLPIYPELTDDEVDYVISRVNALPG